MRRVCFLVHNCADYGGIGTVASNLANEISKKYEVSIISVLDDGRPNMISTDSNLKIKRLIPSGEKLRRQQISLFRPLKKYLKENSIDLLIIMGHFPGFVAAPVRVVSKTRFVFCDHGALINQWHDKKATIMRCVASRLCDKTVVLTEKSYIDYLDRFHAKPNRITYIYNWIEPSDSDSKQYNGKSRKLLSVGRLSEEKGFDQLIEAMKGVAQLYPDWSLDIYGDGPEEQKLMERISALNLEKYITLKGRADNVRDCFKDYAAYVMPSYREGLPISLLEAKMNMLPIVSFDVDTGPREIVRDGVDGILVEPRNISALTDAINRLIEDESMRKRYSDNAKGNLCVFSKDKILPKWIELIEEMMK